jgi:hypothetical protein
LVVLVDWMMIWNALMEGSLCTLKTKPLEAQQFHQKAQRLALYAKMSLLGHDVTPKSGFSFVN